MAERRIIKGWIVERRDDGTLVPIAPADQGGQMPADPSFQYEGPKAATDLQGSQLDNEYKRVQINEAANGKLPVGWRRRPDGGAEPIPGVTVKDPNKPVLSATERANAIAGYQSSLSLDKVIQQLEKQYKLGPGATSGLGGIADYFPTEANRRFDSTGNAARGTVGQALGFTGGQLNSVQEAEMAVGPYLPQSGDRDGVILDKIERLKQVRDDARARSAAMLGGVPDENGNITPLATQQGQTVLPSATGAQQAAGIDPSGVSSKGGLEPIPELAGYENQVIDMIGRGASTGDVVNFMNARLGQYGASVGPELQSWIGGIVQKHNANPRQPVRSLGQGWEMLYHRDRPAGEAQTFLGIDPDSGFGTFLATGANAATAGLPAYLAGKQDVMSAAAAERPGSAMAGEIAGGALGMTGLNKAAGAAGKLGTLLTRGGGIGGDVLYGATRGGFEDGPQGIVTGALAAGAGNKIGSGIASGAGAAVRGVSSPAVRYLADKKIPMTIGQMVGNRGAFGKAMNMLESVPVLGGALQQRRMDGIKAFNEEAFKQAVDPINGPAPGFGPDGIQAAQGAVSRAYDNAYGGINLVPDEQFARQAGAAIEQGRNVPVMGQQFDYVMQNDIAPLGAGESLSGDRLQAALQSLKAARSDFSQEGAMGRKAADAVTGVESAFNDMVERQAPGVMPAIRAANTANRNVSTLGDAVLSNADGLFTPAQLRRAGVGNTKRFGGKRAAARGDIPLADLVNYGQDVLPSTVPNSGTADRALMATILPAALGGGAVGAQQFGEPKVAIPLAALAALTSKQGAKIAQKALTGRSDAARAVGIAIRKNRRKAGLFGASAASAMVPQLSQ